MNVVSCLFYGKSPSTNQRARSILFIFINTDLVGCLEQLIIIHVISQRFQRKNASITEGMFYMKTSLCSVIVRVSVVPEKNCW